MTESTRIPINVRGEVISFLKREVRGGEGCVTDLAESIPERCRNCKDLGRIMTRGDMGEIQTTLDDVARKCPVTYCYMGGVVSSCVLEYREFQTQEADNNRQRHSYYPFAG